MDELVKLIRARRTIHHFLDHEVPRKWITEALESALWAPNHRHTHPWEFSLLGKTGKGLDIREQILTLQMKLKKGASPEKVKSKMLNPPWLLVPSQKKTSDPFQEKEDYASMACALQNMKLVLWNKEIGTKWSTGAITRHPRTYELLGLDPKASEIIGFLWIGKAETIPPPPPRPHLKEVLREFT